MRFFKIHNNNKIVKLIFTNYHVLQNSTSRKWSDYWDDVCEEVSDAHQSASKVWSHVYVHQLFRNEPSNVADINQEDLEKNMPCEGIYVT